MWTGRLHIFLLVIIYHVLTALCADITFLWGPGCLQSRTPARSRGKHTSVNLKLVFTLEVASIVLPPFSLAKSRHVIKAAMTRGRKQNSPLVKGNEYFKTQPAGSKGSVTRKSLKHRVNASPQRALRPDSFQNKGLVENFLRSVVIVSHLSGSFKNQR